MFAGGRSFQFAIAGALVLYLVILINYNGFSKSGSNKVGQDKEFDLLVDRLTSPSLERLTAATDSTTDISTSSFSSLSVPSSSSSSSPSSPSSTSSSSSSSPSPSSSSSNLEELILASNVADFFRSSIRELTISLLKGDEIAAFKLVNQVIRKRQEFIDDYLQRKQQQEDDKKAKEVEEDLEDEEGTEEEEDVDVMENTNGEEDKNDRQQDTTPTTAPIEIMTSPPVTTESSTNEPPPYLEQQDVMIAGNHVFSGEGCTKLEDQCSAPRAEAASLCNKFGDKCIGYTCNKERSDCQLRTLPITYQARPNFVSYFKPKAYENAEKDLKQKQVIEQKKLIENRGTQAAKGFNWKGVCGQDGFKCVVSYGLYGANPKYTEGAIRNAELVKTIFPGWVCRFYHDSSVPTTILDRLTALGAELIRIENIQGAIAGMFWRFLVAEDNTVDRYIVRDTDSRLNAREKAAVDEWIASGYSIHSIRDHPNHNRPLNGGMWGGVKGAVKNIRQLMEQSQRGAYGEDLDFLNQKVWPQVEFDQIAHDSYTCQSYINSKPFPTKRENYQHVGQVFFENDQPRYSDIQCCMVNNPAPVKCRKHPDWEFG